MRSNWRSTPLYLTDIDLIDFLDAVISVDVERLPFLDAFSTLPQPETALHGHESTSRTAFWERHLCSIRQKHRSVMTV